jgi:hypothetical protein
MYTPNQRIGVTQGGVLDRNADDGNVQRKAIRDMSNDRDWFSPASAFENDRGQGKGYAFFLAPFIPVGGKNEEYARRIDAVGFMLYLTNMVLTFLGGFSYCFGALAVVYILGNAGTDAGISSFIIAITSAALWATFAGYWPYDDRVKHHLNPILALCRLVTSDQGLISVAVTIGWLFLAAFAAGASIGHLGWNAWVTAPAGTVLPGNNHSMMAYGMSFFLALLLAVTYTFCEKFEQAVTRESRNWARTVAGTTLAIFWATLIGHQFGFTYVGNPMLSFAAYSSNGGWTTVSQPGLRDSVWFLCIELFAVPAAVFVLYYAVRLGIYLDEYMGSARFEVVRYPKSNYTAQESSIQGGRRATAGLKKRRN